MQFPIPTVRLIVPDKERKVLILRRSQTASYAPGAWCLPGGKVDYGVCVQEAVSKELSEETTLQCVEARFLFYQDSLPPEPGKMHCINLYFECKATGEVKLNEESAEHVWIGPDELDNYEMVFLNDEGLARYWREKESA